MKLSWQRIGALCGLLGPVLFSFFIGLAILVYPGEYNFLLDHLSNLGSTEVSGVPSPLNYLLFFLAYSSAAACMVPFWLALRSVFDEPRRLYHTSLIGSISGILSAVFLSASAFLPGNLLFHQHRWVAIFFFFFLSSAIIVYSYAIMANRDYGNLYALFGLIFVAVLYLHALVPGFESPLVQKVVMFGLIFWSAIQSFKITRAFK